MPPMVKLKNITQKVVSSINFLSGSSRRQWYRYAQHRPLTAVLCYHNVTCELGRNDSFDFEEGITAKDFEAQLKFMLRYFRPVRPSQVHLEDDNPLPRFAVTFDDGLENNFSVAAPILKKLEIPAAFYVVSDYVGTDKVFWWERLAYILRSTHKPSLLTKPFIPDSWKHTDVPDEFQLNNFHTREKTHTELCLLLKQGHHREIDPIIEIIEEILEIEGPTTGREFPLMDWNQLKELSRQGFEIGGHSASHMNLGKADAGDLEREIANSIKEIESHLKQKVLTFAYPYGRSNNRTNHAEEVVGSSGCLSAFTFERQLVVGNQNKFALPRISFKKGWSCACAFHIHNAFLATKSCQESIKGSQIQ